MGTKADKKRLEDEFLDLAARLEGLRQLDPGAVVDPARLKRWQKRYGDNVTKILANRSVLMATPKIVSVDDLQQWVKEARKALTMV
jgi:hypothetical protein